MKVLLIPIVVAVSLVACTPTIDRVEKRDKTLTDSAMSVLDDLSSTYRVDTVSIVKTQTVEKIKIVEVESAPIVSAMIRPSYIEERVCDTVWIRDTVFISR
jgi:uncharacterized protein related to proFAR isomerase